MQEVLALPSVPVGKIKSFGPFGPKYEVVAKMASGWLK